MSCIFLAPATIVMSARDIGSRMHVSEAVGPNVTPKSGSHGQRHCDRQAREPRHIDIASPLTATASEWGRSRSRKEFQTATLLERLMRRVCVVPFEQRGLPSPSREWMGAVDRFGHGRVKVDGKVPYVRRAIFVASRQGSVVRSAPADCLTRNHSWPIQEPTFILQRPANSGTARPKW
jgi:hypothetical protein